MSQHTHDRSIALVGLATLSASLVLLAPAGAAQAAQPAAPSASALHPTTGGSSNIGTFHAYKLLEILNNQG